MGLLVGRNHLMFSLCLPLSAHLSASSFKGSPRWAFILMKMVSRPCSIRSRKSCTVSRMTSASGFPYMEGDLPSCIHHFERRFGGTLSLTEDHRFPVLTFLGVFQC